MEKIKDYNEAKFDKGKVRFSLLDPKFLEGVAKIMTFGAEKYSVNSWQGVPDAEERYKDALLRHIYADEETDPESGESHLLHAACNLMFLYYFERKHEPEDEELQRRELEGAMALYEEA